MPVEIMREHVAVPMDERIAMPAYLARPAAPGRYAAIILGMELFGVTQHIRNVADRLAGEGYLVMAPDFYYRSEAGVELTYDQAGRTRGFQLLHQLSREGALQSVGASMRFIRQRSDFRGRIGFLGFSVGGHIGYLAATQMDLAACACFYAGWLTTTELEISQPEPTLALTPGMAKQSGRMIYFVGEKDFLVDATQREDIRHALREAEISYEMVIYPGVQHGFFCEERDTFDESSRDDAWARCIEMFATELRP